VNAKGVQRQASTPFGVPLHRQAQLRSWNFISLGL